MIGDVDGTVQLGSIAVSDTENNLEVCGLHQIVVIIFTSCPYTTPQLSGNYCWPTAALNELMSAMSFVGGLHGLYQGCSQLHTRGSRQLLCRLLLP